MRRACRVWRKGFALKVSVDFVFLALKFTLCYNDLRFYFRLSVCKAKIAGNKLGL